MPSQGRQTPGILQASTQQGSVVVPGQVRCYLVPNFSCVSNYYIVNIITCIQEPLTTAMLAAAPMQEQKQMLGERLFPLIQVWN